MSAHQSGSTASANTGDSVFLKAVAAISTVSGWCSAAMIMAAVGITCQMIFVRFILNHSTIWQTEAVVYLVIGATLVGLPYVQLLRGHVNVDLLPLALGNGTRKALAVVVLLLGICVVTLMFVFGMEYWHEAWSRNWRSDTVWGVKLWIPYLAVPLGFGLFLLQLLADLYAVLTGYDRPFGLERK